jgi:hypothetical protein
MRKTKLVWTFALMALLLSGVGLGASVPCFLCHVS